MTDQSGLTLDISTEQLEPAERALMTEKQEMDEVAKVNDQSVQTEQSAVLQIISQAATNPNVDIEKMERLLEMQERILERDARQEFAAAFSRMQVALPEIEEKGKGHNNITYAKWEDVNKAIKPVLSEHGFGLSFSVKDDEKFVCVEAELSHRSGHSKSTSYKFPADSSGSKNQIQAVGSSISYGKRYTATALLNLSSRLEPDNNGEGEFISGIQKDKIIQLLQDTNSDVAKFCQHLKIASIDAMPLTQLGKAEKLLEAKKGQIND